MKTNNTGDPREEQYLENLKELKYLLVEKYLEKLEENNFIASDAANIIKLLKETGMLDSGDQEKSLDYPDLPFEDD
jgi:hypothetical protein